MSKATALLLLAGTAMAACNRYEWREPRCPPDPPLAAPWFQAAAADSTAGRLTGLVVDWVTREPLHGPMVTLHAPGSDTLRQIAENGQFSFAPLPQLPVIVSSFMLGYKSRSDTLRGLPPAYQRLTLPLQTWSGECDGFALVRVPKPWWKMW